MLSRVSLLPHAGTALDTGDGAAGLWGCRGRRVFRVAKTMLNEGKRRGSQIFPWVIVMAAAAAAWLVSGTASAGGPVGCMAEDCSSIACVELQTLCLIEEDDAEGAVLMLRSKEDAFRDSGTFHLLLAKAYLSQGNRYWALGTLRAYSDRNPGDCMALSWTAWMLISLAALDEAAELIDTSGCMDGGGALETRLSLMKTFMALQKGVAGREEKKAFLKKKVKKIFPEDIDLYRFTRAGLMPAHVPPLTLRIDLKTGYTTNALFGSAKDPADPGGKKDSALFAHDLRLALQPMIGPWFAAAGELMSRSNVFFMDHAREFTYVDLAWKAGPVVHMTPGGLPRLFLGYRGDVLFLNMADRYDSTPPVVFYEGHRGELELELMPSALFFGGGGRRFFREDVRTRWELDGGLAIQKTLLGRLTLQGAAALRMHKAEGEAYNLYGVSGILMGTLALWRSLGLRIMLAVHGDNYPDSLGYFQAGEIRRDTTFKMGTEIFGSLGKGFGLGCLYEFSNRLSTVDDYRFTDHRIVVKLSFSYGFDFLRLKKHEDEGHVQLDYGLDAKGEGTVQRIQDLLREDEVIRGGASCGCRE